MTVKKLEEAKKLKSDISYTDNVLREINKMRTKTSDYCLTDYKLRATVPDELKDVFLDLLDVHYKKMAKKLEEKFNAL